MTETPTQPTQVAQLPPDPDLYDSPRAELARARRLAALERDFDANPELAALVADLIEEVARLKRRLKAAGLE